MTLDLDDGYLKASESAKEKNKSKSPNTRKNQTLKEFEQWNQQNPTKKTFVVDTMYPDMKKALERRGNFLSNISSSFSEFTLSNKIKVGLKTKILTANYSISNGS